MKLEIKIDRQIILSISIILRLILFFISVYLDNYTSTGYSDIDYKVFTDGS